MVVKASSTGGSRTGIDKRPLLLPVSHEFVAVDHWMVITVQLSGWPICGGQIGRGAPSGRRFFLNRPKFGGYKLEYIITIVEATSTRILAFALVLLDESTIPRIHTLNANYESNTTVSDV
jgi:hypothetical protein